MDDFLIKSGTYIVTFLGGFFVAYSNGWINDHFKQKEERRKQIESYTNVIVDEVAVAVADSYKDKPTYHVIDKIFKAAAQLEKRGKQSEAYVVRSFINKWRIYCDQVVQMGGNAFIVFDEIDENRSRKELDKLADMILNKRF